MSLLNACRRPIHIRWDSSRNDQAAGEILGIIGRRDSHPSGGTWCFSFRMLVKECEIIATSRAVPGIMPTPVLRQTSVQPLFHPNIPGPRYYLLLIRIFLI